MRREDREITDINDIFDILNRCTTINLGMNDDEYPYIIPMTFGCGIENGKICIYFHCAGEGHKWELLHKDPRVCVEAHLYERVEMVGSNDITARYESVIGFGNAKQIETNEEKIHAMKIMLDHYNSSGFPVSSCIGMSRVKVYRIVLDRVTGKRNL